MPLPKAFKDFPHPRYMIMLRENPSYLFTEDLISQLLTQGFEIPSCQKKNVWPLVVFEKGMDPAKQEEILNFYGDERPDSTIHHLYLDGSLYGWNNHRAMPGFVRRYLKSRKPILVRGLGTLHLEMYSPEDSGFSVMHFDQAMMGTHPGQETSGLSVIHLDKGKGYYRHYHLPYKHRKKQKPED